MSRDLEIIAVNLSEQKGTVKRPAERVTVDACGMQGDAHAGPGMRQVSLLGQESIARLAARMGRGIGPGEFGENITLRGLDVRDVACSTACGWATWSWRSRRSARSATAHGVRSSARWDNA